MQPAEDVLPPPAVDAETARETIAEVLRRPEYADLSPGWWDRVVDALRRAFGNIMGEFAGTGAGGLVGWLVLALVVGAAALLLWRWARGLRRDGATGLATAADVGRAPTAWLADAEAHEREGRWRDAVRCRYRALVADLAAAGRLDEVPGRTAGEYLQALRATQPRAGEPFAAATAVFERAWYGQDDVGDEDVAAMRDAASATADAADLRRAVSVGADRSEGA